MLLAIDVVTPHSYRAFDEDELRDSWRMGTPRYKYETSDEIGSVLNFINNSGYDFKYNRSCTLKCGSRVSDEVKNMSRKYFKCSFLLLRMALKLT